MHRDPLFIGVQTVMRFLFTGEICYILNVNLSYSGFMLMTTSPRAQSGETVTQAALRPSFTM